MTLKIKTAEVELEYIDEYNILEEAAKNRILDIINQLYTNQLSGKPIPTVSAYDVFGAMNSK
jgi:hypothetical protein